MNQYTGDGIMALFGAPIAHEDHAQRACYAALAPARRAARATPTSCARARARSSPCAWASTPARSWSARSATTCAWTTRRRGTRSAWRSAWRRLAEPGHVYLTAAHRPAGRRAIFELRDLGASRSRACASRCASSSCEGVGALRTRFDAVARARPLHASSAATDEMAVARGGARARARRRRPGRRRRGRGRHRQEPPVLRVRRALPGARTAGLRGALRWRTARQMPLLPVLELCRAASSASPSDDADRAAREKIAGRLLLLDERPRDELPLVFDFFGVADPAQPLPHGRPGGAAAPLSPRHRAHGARRRRDAARLADRGSPLDRRRRATPSWRRSSRRRPDAPSLVLVNFRPEYQARWMQQLGLPAAPARAARAGGDPRAARRSARRRRERRRRCRTAIHDAHRRQPVLHRGGGAVAGRDRRTWREARRVSADDGRSIALAVPADACRPCWRRASIGCRSARSTCCRRPR